MDKAGSGKEVKEGEGKTVKENGRETEKRKRDLVKGTTDI